MREPIKLQGETGTWEMVLGLEIHAQVKCNSKLFSGSATDFGASPNSQVSYVDAAMPGMLPVINSEAINQAIKTGHALNAKVNNISISDLTEILSFGEQVLPLTNIFSALIQFLIVDLEYSGKRDDIIWSSLRLFSGSISNL